MSEGDPLLRVLEFGGKTWVSLEDYNRMSAKWLREFSALEAKSREMDRNYSRLLERVEAKL